MKTKVVIGLMGLLLAVWMVTPALAQEDSSPVEAGSPVVEVVPIEFERPLPRVDDRGTPRDETVVLGTPLARTGLDATLGVLFGAGLLVVGGAALLLARRRSRAAGA